MARDDHPRAREGLSSHIEKCLKTRLSYVSAIPVGVKKWSRCRVFAQVLQGADWKLTGHLFLNLVLRRKVIQHRNYDSRHHCEIDQELILGLVVRGHPPRQNHRCKRSEEGYEQHQKSHVQASHRGAEQK